MDDRRPCVKVGYASRGEATKEAHKARLFATPYPCGICGAWHFTAGATKKKEHRKKTRIRGAKPGRVLERFLRGMEGARG